MMLLYEAIETVWRYFIDLSLGGALKSFVALVLWVVLAFFDLENPAHKALIYLMVLDYALGAAHAWKCNRFMQLFFWRGLSKFIVYALAIFIADLADKGMGVYLLGTSLSSALCAYLVANEALSALCHLGEFGVPIPPWLLAKLRFYKKNIEAPPEQTTYTQEDDNNDPATRTDNPL